jgi:hypothetical protein
MIIRHIAKWNNEPKLRTPKESRVIESKGTHVHTHRGEGDRRARERKRGSEF